MIRTTARRRASLPRLLGAVLLLGCNPLGSTDISMTMATSSSATTSRYFKPLASMFFSAADGGPFRETMPVPIRRPEGIRLSVIHLEGLYAKANMSKDEADHMKNDVSVPVFVAVFDLANGKLVDRSGYLTEADRLERFGLSDPKPRVLGRFDDPRWLSEKHRATVRARILAALDVLLPLFDDPSRPWTEQANLAAREVRDFFPVAAEPGLWPYYKAEGKDFFAWIEKNAPPEKVPLP